MYYKKTSLRSPKRPNDSTQSVGQNICPDSIVELSTLSRIYLFSCLFIEAFDTMLLCLCNSLGYKKNIYCYLNDNQADDMVCVYLKTSGKSTPRDKIEELLKYACIHTDLRDRN